MYEKRNFRQVRKSNGKIFYEFLIGQDIIKPYSEHLKIETNLFGTTKN